MCQRICFLSFGKNLSDKYRKQLLVTATRRGLDALKTAIKKVAHVAAEATWEFIGNKIANKIKNLKPVSDENSRNVAEIKEKQNKEKKYWMS